MAGAARDYAKVGDSGDSRCAARHGGDREKPVNVPLVDNPAVLRRRPSLGLQWAAVPQTVPPRWEDLRTMAYYLKSKYKSRGRCMWLWWILVRPETMPPLRLWSIGNCLAPRMLVHLELADGSKIRSTQKIPGVMCHDRKNSQL